MMTLYSDEFWPHPVFAEASAVAEWLGYKPRKIELDDWLEKWIPGMEEDRRMIAVFPTVEGQTTTGSDVHSSGRTHAAPILFRKLEFRQGVLLPVGILPAYVRSDPISQL